MYTLFRGLGSDSVHLFSSNFNHRMINSGIMLISISFNASPYDRFDSLIMLLLHDDFRFSIQFSSGHDGRLVQPQNETILITTIGNDSRSLHRPSIASHTYNLMYVLRYKTDLWFNLFVKDARTAMQSHFYRF